MKKAIEKLIPDALAAVRSTLLKEGSSNQVFEEYDGYAASFGASVVTSGLLPTLSFYTDVHKKEVDDKGKFVPRRFKIMQAISKILGKGEGKTALLDAAIEARKQGREPALKTEILAASIALKLALRNFEHVKSSN